MSTSPALECLTSQARRNGEQPRFDEWPRWLTFLSRDAWDSVKGLSKEDAMAQYVEKLIEASRRFISFVSLLDVCL